MLEGESKCISPENEIYIYLYSFSYICFEKARKKTENAKKTDRYELVFMDLVFLRCCGVDYFFNALVFFYKITNFSGMSFSENIAKTPVFFFIASARKI